MVPRQSRGGHIRRIWNLSATSILNWTKRFLCCFALFSCTRVCVYVSVSNLVYIKATVDGVVLNYCQVKDKQRVNIQFETNTHTQIKVKKHKKNCMKIYGSVACSNGNVFTCVFQWNWVDINWFMPFGCVFFLVKCGKSKLKMDFWLESSSNWRKIVFLFALNSRPEFNAIWTQQILMLIFNFTPETDTFWHLSYILFFRPTWRRSFYSIGMFQFKWGSKFQIQRS